MSDTYADLYADEYGDFVANYFFPSILRPRRGSSLIRDGLADPDRGQRKPLRRAATAKMFVKVGSVWSEVGVLPQQRDRMVGGGYQTTVTSTELDELGAAGLITAEDKTTALANPEV